MKKILTRSTAFVLCVLMCASLAACGSKKTELEKYIDSSKSEIDTISTALEQSVEGVSIDISADGNFMVFTFKVTDSSVTVSKDDAEAQLDSLESVFSPMVSSLKGEVSSAEGIRVTFEDAKGDTIASHDFT